jgi:hypothetical protein
MAREKPESRGMGFPLRQENLWLSFGAVTMPLESVSHNRVTKYINAKRQFRLQLPQRILHQHILQINLQIAL